ncbi:D-alanyl-D-alanine carboxypeptidase family protein [Streptomyces lavendofoliae]|uniref:D-alanyl-D-alanine carboxypeptidase n=1 Tax=Streptomyces lavendofoliae TaxID=67314 RepID=A0A918HUB7_9ACTN|nr:serine hydrolase [Streptomyces lavendofoliae]GGU28181.1 D-alanyl-D-alanine carboxypeptidase [Streptomyces lavendofoliae]
MNTAVRRATTVALAGGLLLTASPLAAPAAAATPIPSISAKGGFMVDQATGKAVYGKANTTRRQMASTTKVATAIVVLTTPGVDLNRKITIKQEYRDYVVRTGASTADLKTGDKVTVRQLLSGLMLPSGCDAAYALADAYGTGTTTAARTKSFIAKMNAKASQLGMTNTKFDSFDGISTTGNNYTTPPDLAKLARHAFSSAAFRDVVKATSYKTTATTSTGGTRTYTWYNTNKLLGSYSGAVGIKTGTGTTAGPCLVFAATRGTKTYVGVVLNAPDRFNDAAKLLDFGFGSTTARTMELRSLPAGAQRD